MTAKKSAFLRKLTGLLSAFKLTESLMFAHVGAQINTWKQLMGHDK